MIRVREIFLTTTGNQSQLIGRPTHSLVIIKTSLLLCIETSAFRTVVLGGSLVGM